MPNAIDVLWYRGYTSELWNEGYNYQMQLYHVVGKGVTDILSVVKRDINCKITLPLIHLLE